MTHAIVLATANLLAGALLAIVTAVGARNPDRLVGDRWGIALAGSGAVVGLVTAVLLVAGSGPVFVIGGAFLVAFVVAWGGLALRATGRAGSARWILPVAAIPPLVVLTGPLATQWVRSGPGSRSLFELGTTIGRAGAVGTGGVLVAGVLALLVDRYRTAQPGGAVVAGLAWTGLAPVYAMGVSQYPFVAVPGVATGLGVLAAFADADPDRTTSPLESGAERERWPSYATIAVGGLVVVASVLALAWVLGSSTGGGSGTGDGGLGAALAAATIFLASLVAGLHLVFGVFLVAYGTAASRRGWIRGPLLVTGATVGWLAMLGAYALVTPVSDHPFVAGTLVNPLLGGFLGWVSYRYVQKSDAVVRFDDETTVGETTDQSSE